MDVCSHILYYINTDAVCVHMESVNIIHSVRDTKNKTRLCYLHMCKHVSAVVIPLLHLDFEPLQTRQDKIFLTNV